MGERLAREGEMSRELLPRMCASLPLTLVLSAA